MFKKTLSALAVACVMLVSAAAAGTIFPAEYTDIDGVTRAGYLDEDGMTVLPFAYAQAGDFADCGLAAVENEQWQTAVIDRTGKLVIAYTDSPVSVDFSDTIVAYRYTDHSVYYATDGKRIGSYPGAVGFFEDGLLLCRNADTGLYSYVKQDGSTAFSGSYRKAGAFSNGRTLVQTQDGDYQAIDTEGTVLYTLPNDVTPSYMAIYGESTVVVTNGTNQALYSLSEGKLLTEFLYEHHFGVPRRRSNRSSDQPLGHYGYHRQAADGADVLLSVLHGRGAVRGPQRGRFGFRGGCGRQPVLPHAELHQRLLRAALRSVVAQHRRRYAHLLPQNGRFCSVC